MLCNFVNAVYLMVAGGRWDLLTEYFSLIRLLSQPSLEIVPGTPQDKES